MGQLYLIPDFKNIEESCTQAEKWGAAFEYNDFFRMELMDDKKALKERISFYKAISRDRSKDTLHGAFFDLSVSSEDGRVRELSCMRMRQSMETAAALSVKAVIFHTNLIAGFNLPSYLERWLLFHKEFLTELLKEYRGYGIGTKLMQEMLEALRKDGHTQVSLSVQKRNYAVKMYRKVGFEILSENDEEYIMVCRL